MPTSVPFHSKGDFIGLLSFSLISNFSLLFAALMNFPKFDSFSFYHTCWYPAEVCI